MVLGRINPGEPHLDRLRVAACRQRELGIGWNFLYVGGTTLLTSAYTAAEKARAQAINDTTIFVIGLSCAFSAGAPLERLEWQSMNLALLPWLGLFELAIVGRRARADLIER